MSLAVRRLAVDEMRLAVPLLAPEGWSLEPAELARLHGLGGAVGSFDGDRLVGFLTFLETPPYRWVGNVAVDASMRGKGVGARIVEEAMRGADRVALYSVEKAVTLYARAGFVPHGGVVNVMRAVDARPEPEDAEPYATGDLDALLGLDRAATGMDRSALLRALIGAYPTSVVRRDGQLAAFGVAKTYADVTEVGPVVARTEADAWKVVDDILMRTPPPHDVAVHRSLSGWRQRGFEPSFRAIPMFRGPAPSWDLARYHAAAGLEKG